MALEITDGNIIEVLKQNKITLIDFWAEWCGPCRMLTPVIDELSNSNADVTIGKVNIEENKSIAVKYGVRSIPTLILFNNGEEVERIIGVRSKSFLQGKIDSLK